MSKELHEILDTTHMPVDTDTATLILTLHKQFEQLHIMIELLRRDNEQAKQFLSKCDGDKK